MTKTEFTAATRITLADSAPVIAELCEHMIEHGGTVTRTASEHHVRFPRAGVRFAGGAMMNVDVTAQSLEYLYFIRMMVASHVLEFAKGETLEILWTGDGGDLVRPPNFQILNVTAIRQLTPHMRRITFSGPDIARFAPLTALHLNILVQHPDLEVPQWPSVGANGLIHWADPERRPSFRKYTVRGLDLARSTLDMDFLLHDEAGPGSAFAREAKIGDEIGIAGPGGGGLIDADWYLFAGDETALPAIGRMLEHLPPTARGTALIEVANPDEIQPMASKAAIDIEWLLRGRGPSLADAVRRAAFPANDTKAYAWAGCEFDDFRAIRSYLRKERGLSKDEHLIVAYWRRGMMEGYSKD